MTEYTEAELKFLLKEEQEDNTALRKEIQAEREKNQKINNRLDEIENTKTPEHLKDFESYKAWRTTPEGRKAVQKR
jgi:hypothetical protein